MTFVGHKTKVDLIILDMVVFDAILGTDWLAPYNVVLDCNTKIVTLPLSVCRG